VAVGLHHSMRAGHQRGGSMDKAIIYDIGCNNGDDTDFYLRKGFKVIAVDADKAMCDTVSERFSEKVKSGECEVVFGAVSETNDNVVFYINDDGTGLNTTEPYFVSRNETNYKASYRKVIVPPVNLKELIARTGTPYYMKIDVEGSDIIPLRSLAGERQVPQYISLEIAHHDLSLGLEQIILLQKLGYRRFHFCNQGMRKDVKAPLIPREGSYAAFDPKGQNTGLFGKEIDGKWISFDYAIKRILKINHLHNVFRDNKLYSKNGKFGGTLLSKIHNRYRRHLLHDPVAWYDLHASLS
jgi:FkbM family methyltransferase